MKPGFARDQYGDPWLVVERSGSLWAIGLDNEHSCLAMVHFVADDTINLDLSRPRGIRHLTQVKERCYEV